MIIVILLAGIVCSLVNSVLASIFHIPVFVTTVAMMSVLSAIASQIITTKGGAVGGISIPSEVVKHLDNSAFKIGVLVIWVAICVFVLIIQSLEEEKICRWKPNLCAAFRY